MNENLREKVGLTALKPIFSYFVDNKKKFIELNKEFESVFTINEYDSEWSPDDNNLEVIQKFTFNNPSFLYGEEGITMGKNSIGIAARVYSKMSNFQKTVPFGTVPNSDEPISLEYCINFPKSSIRGDIFIDFFLYLKKVNEINPLQASKAGMILSENYIGNLVIVVDGIGSTFPMTEFEDKKGPLWKLENNWVDASVDSFDSSYVNLSINVAHPLFEQLKSGKQSASRALMGDIMIQAMTTIIQQVVIIEKNSLEENNDSLPNSILNAVQYWVSTFNIDISSLFSIMNTMRSYWDRQMITGGKNND